MIFSWSERIEEGVCDEVQTVLDKADGTPPIVENPDGLDFKIDCNACQVGPGVSYNDNPEELLDTIDMNHMRVPDIEPVGFQTFEHRFNGPFPARDGRELRPGRQEPSAEAWPEVVLHPGKVRNQNDKH